MPIYEYFCPNCKIYFEEIRKHSDKDALTFCEECSFECKKIITAPGGYYIKGNNSASQRPKNAGSFKKESK